MTTIAARGALLVALSALMAIPAEAALTVTPITWDILGLDSNDVGRGPNLYPVGARVCTDAAASNISVTFTWNSSNPYINLRSPATATIESLSSGACADVYYQVELARTPAIYFTARAYRISATDASGTFTTPPRQLYVEKFISQSRNTIVRIEGPTTVMVGDVVTYTVTGDFVPSGLNQLSAFLDFPGDRFELLDVNLVLGNPPDTRVNQPYVDACNWESNPVDPDYQSCQGIGSVGGSFDGAYTVRVIGGPGVVTLSTAVVDYSAGTYHYNTDYRNAPNLHTVTIWDPSSVTISKNFSPDPVAIGGVSTLTFTITNPNPAVLEAVSFSDVFPTSPGAMVVAATPAATITGCGSPTFAPAAGAGSISFSGGTIAASGTCRVTVNVTVPTAGTYTNTSSNLFFRSGAVDTGNSATDTLSTVAAAADISVQKTLTTAGPYRRGQAVSYTIVVANAGPQTATSVQVTDTPTNLTLTAVSGGGCSSLPCTIPTLAAGSSATLTVAATINALGAFDNAAAASAAEGDPNPSNNTDAAGNGGNAAPSADVAVTKTASPTALLVGDSLRYTIVVMNNGPDTATAVQVVDPLPAGFSVSAASSTQGTCGGTTVVTCNVGTMNNGATVTITIDGIVREAGTLSNTASVSASENDGVAANNVSTASVNVIPPVIPTASPSVLLLLAAALAAAGVAVIRHH